MEEIFRILREKPIKLCGLATTHNNSPQLAVMSYVITDNNQILLCTNQHTRKWNNININNHIALVIGWTFEEPNIQLEGTAKLLNDQKTADLYFSLHPTAAKFRNEFTGFIEIKPTWGRITKLNEHPHSCKEYNFKESVTGKKCD